jgi:hypothetical protein
MRWNKEEISRLQSMRNVENMDWGDIGLILNRTYQACRVKYNKEARIERLKAINNMGFIKNNNKSWTEGDIKLLMGMVKKGVPLNKIAQQLKRTTKAVQVKVGRELLPADKPTAIPRPVKPKEVIKAYKKSIKYSARISRHTINASTIFDYIKHLELENKELQQRIKNIQSLLSHIKDATK